MLIGCPPTIMSLSSDRGGGIGAQTLIGQGARHRIGAGRRRRVWRNLVSDFCLGIPLSTIADPLRGGGMTTRGRVNPPTGFFSLPFGAATVVDGSSP